MIIKQMLKKLIINKIYNIHVFIAYFNYKYYLFIYLKI